MQFFFHSQPTSSYVTRFYLLDYLLRKAPHSHLQLPSSIRRFVPPGGFSSRANLAKTRVFNFFVIQLFSAFQHRSGLRALFSSFNGHSRSRWVECVVMSAVKWYRCQNSYNNAIIFIIFKFTIELDLVVYFNSVTDTMVPLSIFFLSLSMEMNWLWKIQINPLVVFTFVVVNVTIATARGNNR